MVETSESEGERTRLHPALPVEGVLNPSNGVLNPSNCAEALDKRAGQLV